MAAADSLRVVLHGGGHGSMPQTTVDPVVMVAVTCNDTDATGQVRTALGLARWQRPLSQARVRGRPLRPP